jgi:uncharacterized membrane protein YphA (DoxX/SURF4 family)
MSTRRASRGFAPVWLRLALAVTFIWAGMAKIRSTMDVDGELAATLANMGVITPTTATPGASTGAPVTPLPPPAEGVKPEEGQKPATPGSEDGRVDSGGVQSGVVRVSLQDAGSGTTPPAGNAAAPSTTQASGQYTAADFPEKVKVKVVYMLAATLHQAAHPKATPERPSPMSLWPPVLAKGRMPVTIAWLVTIAELGGGILVLLGLCTRLGAFALAGVMVGAMWLSQIGPAVQSGKTVLGFLPDHARYDGMAWTPLLFQFALFSMAMALLFTGPGVLAADHALFGPKRKNEDHDGE